MKIGVGAETKYRGNHFMKGAKWRALFCFIVALAAGCFAAACAEEHVHEYEAVVTPPTCTEQGYTTYTCPEDGESYVGDYVEPLGHTPAEAVKENVVDATCLGGGSYDLTIYCSVCGEELSRESVEVEKKDHTPEVVPGKEATCTQAGLTEGSKCSVCGTVLKEQEEIPAKGHTPSEAKKENEKAATCTEAGSYDEVVYCSVCEKEISRKHVQTAALGHAWSSGTVTTAPTCSATGVRTYTCSRCDAKRTESIPMTAHTPETVPGKDATCTDDGLTEGSKCSVCGTVLKEQEEIPAKGHTPSEAKKENEKAATCTEAGSYDEVVYCTVCEIELSRRTVTVPKAEHTPGAAATCTSPQICTACGMTLADALDHAWGTGTVTKEPTCTEEGIETVTCIRCNATQTQAIDSLGHDLVHHEGQAATCTAAGWEAYVACSRCSYTTYQEIPVAGHKFADHVCSVCYAIEMVGQGNVPVGNTVAVHDPSIIVAYADAFGNIYPDTGETGSGRQKMYFIFGTQLSFAYSYDMESWVTFTPVFYEEDSTVVSTDHTKIFASAAAWPGYADADTIKGNLWAPDIIYNTKLEKWCLYYSMSGDSSNFRSSVFMMAADKLTGPYVFEDFVVFSGFNKGTGAGVEDYKKVTGESSVPERYSNDKRAWNNNYGVSCIDPSVMYDEEGELWLNYGSWSGGIFLLKLDNETGLRDTSRTYGSGGQPIYDTDEKTALREDPYLGIHVAGGWYVSGEGPYIAYFNGYYYLFLSYGFYSPEGGYNMRVFRSKDITGKYTDMDGTWAVYASGGNNYGNDLSHGEVLMQNYKWSWWTNGYTAQGHNSVLVDGDKIYLVYHVKYNDGSIQHNVEVHELVIGENGWPLAAPFQKSVCDKVVTDAAKNDLAGSWSVILHTPVDYANLQVNTDKLITLNADGTVAGDYTGNWNVDGQYITITIDGVEYRGVVMEQLIEGLADGSVTYTFTATNAEANTPLWGAKISSDAWAVQTALDSITFPDTILGGLVFETQGLWGTTIAYSSSNTDVLANDGTFTAPAEDTNLTLTVTVSIGSASISKTKEFTIKGLSEDSIKQMLPNSIADDGYLVKAEPGAGGSIAPIGKLSNYTGVSFTFRVKDVKTDWDVMFRTANGTQVYLSVLNYKNVNIFESAATLSEEAKIILQEHGLETDGSESWQLFLGSLCEGGECVATISYNVDGTITFYRDGELMLTYAADTEIGTGTVSDLVRTMVAQVRMQGLNVVYPVSNVIIGYAADYDKDNVPTRVPIETLGTDNGDGTYELAFGDWRQTQNVQGDFKVVYDINVKAPSASTVWFNWVLKIGDDWALRADHYSGNINDGFKQIAEVQYSAAMSPNYVNDYLDADVILTIERTGASVTVTVEVTSLSTGDEFAYTATYASFGTQDTTVSLGGENCLINVYKVTAESGEGPVEPPHEHSFGEYADDVATCSCGATKVKYVVGSTTAEVIFESRENAEVVTNTDTSGAWDPWVWVNVTPVSGDFAIQYTWKNTRDANWYQDIILQLTDGTNYLTKNFLASALLNTKTDPQLWTGTLNSTVTFNGETATLPAQGDTANGCFAGDYTANIVRIGSTLIIEQTLVASDGTWKVVDRYENFPESDLNVQLTGNPYWVDDLRLTVGEMNKTGTAAMDKELGNPDNSTVYTGNTPLWTSTIQQGQKITVTGTATSSGANVWNAPLAYLWTGNTASLNFRADDWVNGVDADPDQITVVSPVEVDAFNFSIAKEWKGFTSADLNVDWRASLIDHYKQGAFDCTVTWDYSEANKIVVQYSFAWEDATFNQQYTITPQSGDLSESYSIGLGVDCAYYHVTGMTVE